MRVRFLLALIATPSISGAALVAPTNLVATATSGTSISVTWADSNTSESGFTIERSPDGATFSVVASTGINVTSYVNGGLTSGGRYYYRVRAFDSGNKT